MQRILAHLDSFRVLNSARLYGVRRLIGLHLALIPATLLSMAWVLAQTPVTMQISDIHGQTWKGNIVSVDQEQVVYKPTDTSNGAEIIKKTEEILRIDRSGNQKPVSVAESIRAGLVDGSLLNLQKIEGMEKNWTIEFPTGTAQNGFVGELKYLKFKKLDNNAQEAWEAYLREDIKSDALIVIRPGGSLDRVDGVVKEIRAGKVLFDVDGQVVEASVERLAGVIWYRKQQAAGKGFPIRLSDGSTLNSRKVSFNDGSAQLAGSWGESLIVPVDWIESIDCGLNKMAWVSSVETLEAVALKKAGFGEFDMVLASTFKPRWVEGEGGNQNLLFSGPGVYVFRAPVGMTKLQTRLQRATESNAQSAVSIEVWVDDQVALKKELGAEQQSVDVEVGIASEKKIKFVVASKSALNLGTRVMLIQPRVSK